jgi:pimeloyl-ACP methyl ester carboxylesterase
MTTQTETSIMKDYAAAGGLRTYYEAQGTSHLAAITAPTLIVAGDDDFVAVEHLEAMRTALPDGQLAIVPGTSHGLPLEKPELVSRLIFDFLSDEQAEKLMPSPR